MADVIKRLFSLSQIPSKTHMFIYFSSFPYQRISAPFILYTHIQCFFVVIIFESNFIRQKYRETLYFDLFPILSHQRISFGFLIFIFLFVLLRL